MAYAALISLAQTIEKIILKHDHYSISIHHKHQILSLDKYIIVLQEFLEDFPNKAKANCLEGKINDAANEAEDTIEFIMWKLEGKINDAANEAEDTIEFFMWKRTRSRFRLNSFATLPANYAGLKLKLRLKKTIQKIDSITGKVMAIKNNDSATIKVDSTEASSSSRKIDDVVGLHDDLLAIKSRLCEETSKLQIIPIVGMGGIGKTTLARNAYDDPFTMQHFDIRAWVTVSQDHSISQILSSLFHSLKPPNEEIAQNDELVGLEVFQSLKYRRYLIVLDDMWSTEAWDDVSRTFPDDGNGSRIMLTTRLSDVASYPDNFSLSHEMHLMNADRSWDLLKAKVFGNQDCPLELESIGKKIAEGCEGLPLAIVVIGGLLSKLSRDPNSWREIAENVNSVVAAKQGHFEEILSLSYTHLPHHLRPCFLYLGSFHEDYEIRASFLVRLWVAEGFLRPQEESKSLEDVAEDCLEDLVRRSLVMISKRKSNGKIKSCRLHNLVRDLCIRKAHEERFLANIWGADVRKDHHRRVSNVSHLPKRCCSTIRTIMCFRYFSSICSLKGLKLLRLLVVGVACDSLPSQLYSSFIIYKTPWYGLF